MMLKWTRWLLIAIVGLCGVGAALAQNTPVPTATPTPQLQVIRVSEATQVLTIETRTADLNAEMVAYTVRILDKDNVQVREISVRTALPNPLLLDSVDAKGNPLGDSDYTLQLEIELSDGRELAFPSFAFSKAPQPTPTPLPGVVDQIGEVVQANPVVPIVFGVVLAALLGLVWWLIRRRRQQDAGGYQLRPSPPPSAPANMGATGRWNEPATEVGVERVTYGDKGARLTLTRGDGEVAGKTWDFHSREMPFRIGRGGGDHTINLTIRDPGVGKLHATITYNNGKYYIIDENSVNGTFIDEVAIPRGSRKALENGVHIRLGLNSEFLFTDKNAEFAEIVKQTGRNPVAPPVPKPAVPTPVAAPAPASTWEDEATSVSNSLPLSVSATLEIVNGFNVPAGKRPISEEEVVFGRKRDVVTLAFESTAISRRHARLFYLSNAFYLEDLGSGNGTFLNGKQLQKDAPTGSAAQFAVQMPVRLDPYTTYEIRLGKDANAVLMRFQYSQAGGSLDDEATSVRL